MPIVNKTPAIFDLSVKWEPKEQRPLQEPGQDQRSKFDFPTFVYSDAGNDSHPLDDYEEVSITFCDGEDEVTKLVLARDPDPE